jgi:hypothetical protein
MDMRFRRMIRHHLDILNVGSFKHSVRAHEADVTVAVTTPWPLPETSPNTSLIVSMDLLEHLQVATSVGIATVLFITILRKSR